MSVRSTAVAASVLMLALVFASTASTASAPRDRGAPTAPTNLRITASSATSVSLAWNAASDNSSNWWYCVRIDGAGCFRVDPPKTTFTYPNAMPNRTFNFSVIAIDAAGNRSAPSNTVTFTTPPDTTPPSPAPVLTATSVFPARLSVAWTGATDNTSQVFYTFTVNGRPHASSMLGIRGWTLLHLTPETSYTMQVTARDSYGNAVQSNVLTVTTPPKTDMLAPSAPTNLRLSFESTDFEEAWLDWDQSFDDVDPQSQILYDVYLNGVRNDDGVIGWGETVTYCREPGPTEIVIRAVDTSGNVSAPSNPIVFPC